MKNSILFESNRVFGLYSFEGPHSKLLLRSMKSTVDPKRIDILFFMTKAMEIRTLFDGLKIFETDVSFLDAFDSKPAELIKSPNRVCRLVSNAWEGFIVATEVYYKEDDELYSAPTKITSADILRPR
jgi:hypothetical protein